MSCEHGGYLTSHCKSCEHWLDDYASWDFGCTNLHYNECPHLKPIEFKESKTRHKYLYNGPVLIFGNCIQSRWRGETKAISKSKAYSNLTYQWKVDHGYASNTAISLPGPITMLE